MSTQPLPHIQADEVHHAQGIDALSFDQMVSLGNAIGASSLANKNSLAHAEYPGMIQNMVNARAGNGWLAMIEEKNPAQYGEVAVALGFQDPTGLSQADRVTQSQAVAAKFSSLVL